MRKIELPDAVESRARSMGRLGEAWLRDLPGLIADLEVRWSIGIGDPLPGGSSAFVAPAECIDGDADDVRDGGADRPAGTQCIVRIDLPDDGSHGDVVRQVRVLNRAAGRGYPRLYGHDLANRAMLIERLGAPLSDSAADVDQQLQAICAALAQTWTVRTSGLNLPGPLESTRWFRGFITQRWEQLGQQCPRVVVTRALEYLDALDAELVGQVGTDALVLVHGDAHAGNCLEDPTRPGAYRLIDPDGAVGTRAQDLGVLMREWQNEYFLDPVSAGRARARRLADLTGEAAESIWRWGFIQSVSTAFVLARIGQADQCGQMLDTARAWAEAGD